MQIRLSNGLAIGYQTSGTGRVMVLLHPIGTGASFWAPMMRELEREYRCIAIDLRGHGGSDTPLRRFTLDDLADDVIEMLRAQQLDDVILVGCSFGGMVAQGALLRAPELFAGAVLTGTTHVQTDESRDTLLKRAAETRLGMEPLLESTMNRWFAPGFFAQNPNSVAEVRSWLLGIDPIAFAWSWEAIAGVYYGDLLKHIKTPSLLLRGSHDPSGRTMPAMAALMQQARFVEVEGLGHMAPYEGSKKIAGLIRDFVETEVVQARGRTFCTAV
ncbi:3-oxoadipate enol-lactonase [Bradyrhizobium sp. USDA 4449]